MSVLDLYADDFPHGSQAGYDLGCHGTSACPNFGSPTLLTCVEARQRRAGDYQASRLPLDTVLERPDPPKAGPKPLAPKRDPHVEPIPEPEPIVGHSYPHGTMKGYSKGCSVDADCPGDPDTGATCHDAAREYWRVAAEKRRLNKLSAEEVTEPVKRNSGDVSGPSAETPIPEAYEAASEAYPTGSMAIMEERAKVARNELTLAEQANNTLARENHLLDEKYTVLQARMDELLATNASLAATIHDLEVKLAAAQSLVAAYAEGLISFDESDRINATEPLAVPTGGGYTDQPGAHGNDHHPHRRLTDAH